MPDSDEQNEPPVSDGRGGEPEVSPSAELAARRRLHEVVHAWIPLAIAVVSVLAAVMGWRASLADESATHTEELSRQALVQQQQLLVQDNDAINSDLRTFGQFSQYSLLAHSALQDAGRVGGGAGDQLRAEGQADLGIARYMGKQIHFLNYAFDPSSPGGNGVLHSDGTYLPGHPYAADLALDVARNFDVPLHGLAPEQLHAKADAERTHGVDLTGIAALFVGVMVLLTLGAVVTGPAKTWLAGSGLGVAVLGVVLAVVVELS
jgi:hypothetical protein